MKSTMMYVISDNAYFSYGFCELLKEGGKDVKNLPFPCETDLVEEFNKDDFILLVVEDLYLLGEIIFSLPSYVMAIIFIGSPHFDVVENLASKIGGQSMCYMKSTSILFFLQKIIMDNKSRCDFHTLTDRERIIMNSLSSGMPVHRISSMLNIDVKTISTYKINALKKLGLTGLNARALFIYKIIALTNKFSACIYDSGKNSNKIAIG